jgi:hypothetical protein
LRAILIRLLGFFVPLLLIAWAVYICELECYRLFGAYLVEVPPTEARLLPSPSPQPRGFLERQSRP